MVLIRENVPLLRYNTFGVDVRARYFCEINTTEELQELIKSGVFQENPHLTLGEGSNILFTRDFQGLIIKMNIKFIEHRAEDNDTVVIEAGAGEVWHDLVMYCVNHDFGGIENLSLIPGTCGAAPIQNIGAYGVEVENCIQHINAVDVTTGEERTFEKEECLFSYRESVFKHALRKKYFISSITLTLTKKNHFFNTQYGALNDTLKRHGVSNESQLTVKAISDAVIEIRQQKLPDVHVLGSAGSFFKNPTITKNQFSIIKAKHPLIPSYPSVNQHIKIPAGWLIEQCGWKGKKIGHAGVHEHQALVIVNYGGASGEEIFQLALNIQSSVKEKFNVELETEVNIIR